MKQYQSSPQLVRTLHLTFWTLLFVVFPLTVNPYAFYSPAETYVLLPKAFVLAITFTIGLIALIFTYTEVSLTTFVQGLRRQPLTLQAWLALSVFLLLDAFLLPGDTAINLIGSRGRVDGLLVQAAWYALVPMAAGLYYARADNKQTRQLIFMGAIITALWTLAQSYGFEPATQVFPASVRNALSKPNITAEGPLALTGLTAAYLAVVGAFYLASETTFTPVTALGLGVLSTALIATGNRTAPAAFILVSMFLLIVYLLHKRFRLARNLVLYGVVSLAMLGAWQVTRTTPIEQFERTTQFVQGTDSSFQVRVILWRAALRALFDRPLTGYGPNGFGTVFWQHTNRDEQLDIVNTRLPEEATNIRFTGSPVVFYSLPEREETITATFSIDKAHNYVLDLTVASGLLGTGLFVVAIASGLVLMLRASSRLARAVALGVCVYAIFGITWFATLPVDPLVWGLFGIGVGSALRTHVAPPITTLRKDKDSQR